MPALIPKRITPRFFSVLTSCTSGLTALLLPYAVTVPVANVLHLLCASAFVSQGAPRATHNSNGVGTVGYFWYIVSCTVIANGLGATGAGTVWIENSVSTKTPVWHH